MARRGERGIRNIRVNGRRVWQARVAWRGQRRRRRSVGTRRRRLLDERLGSV
jgi:hypothetical protein